MKKNLLFLSILFSTLFISCTSTKYSPVQLNYDQDSSTGYAYIYFDVDNLKNLSGATFVKYASSPIYVPEQNTYWSPVEVPANEPIGIIVHCKYIEDTAPINTDNAFLELLEFGVNILESTRNVDEDVYFAIPPLIERKMYLIEFKKESGYPGKNYLILKDYSNNKVIKTIEFKSYKNNETITEQNETNYDDIDDVIFITDN